VLLAGRQGHSQVGVLAFNHFDVLVLHPLDVSWPDEAVDHKHDQVAQVQSHFDTPEQLASINLFLEFLVGCCAWLVTSRLSLGREDFFLAVRIDQLANFPSLAAQALCRVVQLLVFVDREPATSLVYLLDFRELRHGVDVASALCIAQCLANEAQVAADGRCRQLVSAELVDEFFDEEIVDVLQVVIFKERSYLLAVPIQE